MTRLLLFLALLIGSVWLGLQIYADPGYALLTYRGWSVETPLWFAIFVVVIVFVFAHILLALLRALDGFLNSCAHGHVHDVYYAHASRQIMV